MTDAFFKIKGISIGALLVCFVLGYWAPAWAESPGQASSGEQPVQDLVVAPRPVPQQSLKALPPQIYRFRLGIGVLEVVEVRGGQQTVRVIVELPGATRDLVQLGHMVYIARDTNGVTGIDVSDPLHLREVSTFAIEQPVIGLSADGTTMTLRLVDGDSLTYDAAIPGHEAYRAKYNRTGVLADSPSLQMPRSGRGMIIVGAILLPLGLPFLAGGGILIAQARDYAASHHCDPIFGCQFTSNGFGLDLPYGSGGPIGGVLVVFGSAIVITGTALLAVGARRWTAPSAQLRAGVRRRVASFQFRP